MRRVKRGEKGKGPEEGHEERSQGPRSRRLSFRDAEEANDGCRA